MMQRAPHFSPSIITPLLPQLAPSLRKQSPMSSPVKSYLKALLALSEDKTLESSRRSLLQSLSDADLQKVVQHGVGREFARGELEEIAVTILDVISREPQADYEDGATRDAPVKVEQEPDGDGDNIVVLAPPPQRRTWDSTTNHS